MCILIFPQRRVIFSEIRNNTEPNTKYVRVLDPRAQEISFVRTDCPKKETLYVSCSNLGMPSYSIQYFRSEIRLYLIHYSYGERM